MIYRTVGQFKTSYRRDQALFPVRQDAFLLAVILLFAWVIFPLTASEFAYLCAGGDGFELVDGVCRAIVAGHGGFHGCWRLCLL